jgi:Undecaprenyl-phosphate galactose phosphotransferase WbaP
LTQPVTNPVSIDGKKQRAAKKQWVMHKQRLAILALIFSDITLAFLVWQVALLLQSIWGRGPLSDVSVAGIVPFAAMWVGLRALLGLYPGYGWGPVEELRRQTHAVVAALAGIAIVGIAFQVGNLISRLLLALSFLGLFVLAPLVRYFVKCQTLKLGLWGKPVVIMGSGKVGAQVVRLLEEEWQLGYKPVAIFDSREAPAEGSLEGVPYEGTVIDAMSSDWKQAADTAIFAMPHTPRKSLAKYVARASDKFRHVVIIPDLSGVTNSAVVARDLAGTFAAEIKYNLLDPWALRTKRTLDLGVTVVGGVLVLPLILVLSLLVWLESGGPVFYADRRTGQYGELFSCVKFRTMVPNAEAKLQRMLEEDTEMREEYLKYHKLRDDPRVTRVGHFLRKTSLDELPQLWNVLRGEMSLVGPRPYLPRESGEIGAAQSEILRVPPGITGPWQVAGRNHTTFKERVQMDSKYVRDWSVWLDIVLLARTVKCLALNRGAY